MDLLRRDRAVLAGVMNLLWVGILSAFVYGREDSAPR